MDRTYYGARTDELVTPTEKGWPVPGWSPSPKKRPKCGSGLRKRYFDVIQNRDGQDTGQHGASKKGWGPTLS